MIDYKSLKKKKDFGVVINNRLSPEEHIQEKVRNMHNLLANMRVAFTYIDEAMIKKIITSFIQHTLEYAAVVWNAHLKKKTHREDRESAKSNQEIGAEFKRSQL